METIKLTLLKKNQEVFVVPKLWNSTKEPMTYIVTYIGEKGIFARPIDSEGVKRFDINTMEYKGLFDDYKMFTTKEEYYEYASKNEKGYSEETVIHNDKREKVREEVTSLFRGIKREEINDLLETLRIKQMSCN